MTDRRLAWIVAGTAFALLLPTAFFGLPDCKPVVGATRILDGDVPYRDFWTMYAPGSFYAIAGLFAAFGRELAVQGVATCAVWAAATAVLFRILRAIDASRPLALALCGVFTLMRWGPGAELTSYPPALLLVLLAIRDVLESRPLRAGLLLGLAALFKHDVAAYAGIAAGLGLIVERRSPLPIVLGALAIVLPLGALLASAAGPDLWRDLFVFPATDFAGVRREAYPGLLPNLAPIQAFAADPNAGRAAAAVLATARWIACFFPQIAFLAGAGAWLALRGRMPLAGRIALAAFPLFWLAAHVQQNTHLHSMATLSAVLFALAWERVRRGRKAALAVAGSIYALGLLAPFALSAAFVARELPRSETLGFPGVAGVRLTADEAATYRPIVAFVRERVPRREPIYVGLTRHDATVISNQRFYFLCDRRPAGRYNELHPGITDREEVQREIAASIESQGARCLVLWRFGWSKERLDSIRDRNRAAVAGAGSDWLDRWIAERFETVLEHDQYRVLFRK